VTPPQTSAFALPARRAAKAAPALIADDEERFAEIGAALAEARADTARRIAAVLEEPSRSGEAALDRDLEIHRLSAQQRTLDRYGLDLCVGRVTYATATRADSVAHLYIGRTGMTDATGRRLLVDWRAPAAEPYFSATPARPMGVAVRRRYRFTGGRVSDYWDEALSGNVESSAALDDESAFIASLGASRSPQMRDVLSTVQADQDAIIRADSHGALVIDGGPGTGKTVVALHRAAYLLYADPRLAPGRGGILFIGPHESYLAYVADVLPSLGEESVRMCTLRDLVPEGRRAVDETDPRVALLKSDARWSKAIEAAVSRYEQPPNEPVMIETPWMDVTLGPDDWAEAFAAVERGTPHDAAREDIVEILADIVVDRMRAGRSAPGVRRYLARPGALTEALDACWPLLDPAALVASLWASPSFLRSCAPWLSDDDARSLHRGDIPGVLDDRQPWTRSDLPLLDAARARVGDPSAALRDRRREAELAARRDVMDRVVDDLIAADDSELKLMSMLRVEDAQRSLIDDAGIATGDTRDVDGPFAHIVVDEAQDLTDAEWQMVLRRCPSRSVTIVGDRAQARRRFTESWAERLARVGFAHVEVARLTVNYRTPEEVMSVAEPVIRAAIPDANVPTSVRRSGIPVRFARVTETDEIVEEWLAENEDGIACVIGDPARPDSPRVRSLTPEGAKGLEFDLVVLVDDDRGTAADRYVAMTRSTRELVIVTGATLEP
jgi:DNA polymerase III delta prime subunit